MFAPVSGKLFFFLLVRLSDDRFFSLRLFRYASTEVIDWALELLLLNITSVKEPVICEAVQAAAQKGRLDFLKKLHPHKAIDAKACASAALGGQLEVLKWLREHVRI